MCCNDRWSERLLLRNSEQTRLGVRFRKTEPETAQTAGSRNGRPLPPLDVGYKTQKFVTAGPKTKAYAKRLGGVPHDQSRRDRSLDHVARPRTRDLI